MKPDETRELLPTIRSATPADAETIVRIYIDSWNAGFGALLSQADRTVTPALTERWHHDLAQPAPHRWWVAERMGSIAGFVGIGPSRDPVDARLGELDTIAVCPSHWRTGIGKVLMSVALRHLVADGYDEAIVWTVQGYGRGIAFYEAMGWNCDGGVRDEGRQIRLRLDLATVKQIGTTISEMKKEESIDADYLAPAKYDQYYGAYATLPDWFLAELASRRRVLELACGTGRIAIPLAEHGLEVTGIDYSEPMLSLARAKAEGKQVRVNWICDDIRRFDTGRQYGSILLLSNALWHLHDLADFEECIRCVKRHLAPGGYFILDVFVPGLEILNRDPSRRYPFSRYTDDDTGQEVQVTQSYRYEADTQVARMVHYRGDSDEIVGGLNLRMYFPQELDALLKYNGMRVKEKFGNWDRDAFGPDSRHQLCFCTTMETG